MADKFGMAGYGCEAVKGLVASVGHKMKIKTKNVEIHENAVNMFRQKIELLTLSECQASMSNV